LAAILAIALATRLLAAGVIHWFVAHSGAGRLCIFPDTEYYWLLARTIRAGATYQVIEWGTVPHLALRTPGYPLFLAACQFFFGESTLAVRLVQAVLGTASIWLVYRLAQQFDRRIAPTGGPKYATVPLFSAGLAAVDPFLVAMSEVLLSEALFIPLLLVFLCGLASLWRMTQEADGSGGHLSMPSAGLLALATGAAGGAAILTRPSFALFVPVVLLSWILAGAAARCLRPAWRGSLFVVLGAAVVMSPWWVRNARVFGRFVPTSVWLGASLYDGLNPRATGASDMKFLAEPQFRKLNELEQDAALRRRAIEFARANPERVLELAVVKFQRYWSPWLNAAEYRSGILTVASTAMVIPTYFLVIAGAWDRRRDLRALALLAGPLVYFCAVHVVFVSSVRYRISGEAPALALAAIGLARLFQRLGRGRRRPNPSDRSDRSDSPGGVR
jgi:4-amino-4-deoxy-L-arabinose transferase-like glycosyltransferase